MLDDGTVKVIAAILATISAITVAWIANRQSKRVSQQPEMPRPTARDLDDQQHRTTREQMRDMTIEFRGRFDRLDDKIQGDPDMRELIMKLDGMRKQAPGDPQG